MLKLLVLSICVVFVQFHGFLLPIVKELNGFVSRRQLAFRVKLVHKKYLKENVAVTYDLIQLITKVILKNKVMVARYIRIYI